MFERLEAPVQESRFDSLKKLDLMVQASRFDLLKQLNNLVVESNLSNQEIAIAAGMSERRFLEFLNNDARAFNMHAIFKVCIALGVEIKLI